MNTLTQSITEQKIIEQLTANTGTHFLDSGGAYGRNWEKNQLRDFNSEKATALKFEIWNDTWQMEVAHNVFHFLRECLEYDEAMDNAFVAFSNLPKNADCSWPGVVENWKEKVNDDDAYYNWGENTYNRECLLSQVLQYDLFEIKGTCYIALQIHGGCDVRGGYTRPYIYQYNPEDSYPAIDYSHRATITCNYSPDLRQTKLPGVEINEDPHRWDFESACYYQIEGPSKFKDLEHTGNESEKGKGKLYIDENGNGYCPHCGEILEASY